MGAMQKNTDIISVEYSETSFLPIAALPSTEILFRRWSKPNASNE
jgi:hypothetical protein